jgi:glutamine synthetase
MDLTALFSSCVFDDEKMKERLSEKDYAEFEATVKNGEPLSKELASAVATAMKQWAIEKGATHFSHWFQPMTGVTAEKHDGFIFPDGNGGAILEFSGKSLIKGEGDASSFPNGGLRSTFEARGYTVWDPTSHAFVKDETLYIPTAFCSYSGQVLDEKTPLLRSTSLVCKQAQRVLKCFGIDEKITVTVGPEQEYFLIDKESYLKRKDLIFTGRTLFGAKPPKGQELDDHYYGNIRPRVLAFMEDLDKQLWSLGVPAKTRHNEVAPSQHELAPVYMPVTIAADQNELTMQLMQTTAEKHGLICLLHEKPFAGINGSGKHDNWSLATSKGNLLDPGKNPQDNVTFLLFMAAVITAVDRHQDLLRFSIASAGNDHRLGANEAPPAIISMYLGDDLISVIESLGGKSYEKQSRKNMDMASGVIPQFKRDTTDRNRTSPFAFTGNKFEFRMLGSSCNISTPNTVINTAVAEALDEFAATLEKASDVNACARKLVIDAYERHKRIIFNGNGYSEEWKKEAEARGLLNIDNTPAAIRKFAEKQNVELFTKYGVFSEEEIVARTEILLEKYCKTINIEARTMIETAAKEILPAAIKFASDLARAIDLKTRVGEKRITPSTEIDLLAKINAITCDAYSALGTLKSELEKVNAKKDFYGASTLYREKIVPLCELLRKHCDGLETMVAKDYWPFPTYSDILFSV